MSDDYEIEDLDGIDGRSFVAWLIYTGTGATIAYMPWTFADAFFDALENPPVPPGPIDGVDDMFQIMSAEMLKPMIPVGLSVLVCGIGAALIVLAARSGMRLHALLVMLIGVVIGALTAAVMGSGEIEDLAFGAITGIAAAGAVAIIRKLVIQGG